MGLKGTSSAGQYVYMATSIYPQKKVGFVFDVRCLEIDKVFFCSGTRLSVIPRGRMLYKSIALRTSGQHQSNLINHQPRPAAPARGPSRHPGQKTTAQHPAIVETANHRPLRHISDNNQLTHIRDCVPNQFHIYQPPGLNPIRR